MMICSNYNDNQMCIKCAMLIMDSLEVLCIVVLGLAFFLSAGEWAEWHFFDPLASGTIRPTRQGIQKIKFSFV